VALVICGESHEDVIDLTRSKGIFEPKLGWMEVPAPPTSSGSVERLGYNPRDAVKSKHALTLAAAKKWAAAVLEEEDEEDDEGATLHFETKTAAGVGVARLFSSGTLPSAAHPLARSAKLYRWCDQDSEAYHFNQRRLAGESIPVAEQDALTSERKQLRLADGLELFDDWILRQSQRAADNSATKNALHVHLVLENQVPPSEVELHVEPGVGPAPPAHDLIRAMELDSDSDSDLDDPDDGTASFADYLLRRAEAHLPPGHVHCVDPRDMGNPEDDEKNAALQALLPRGLLPQDLEHVELTAQNAQEAVKADSSDSKDDKMLQKSKKMLGGKVGYRCSTEPSPLPSWESFFGTVAGLLYYSPHMKVDFVPLLVKCGLCTSQSLTEFFEKLYFGTVPDALNLLGPLDDESRSLMRVRSLAYKSPTGALMRRPHDKGLVPVKAAPIDSYLKARGSQPPRTWVSGLAAEVRSKGAGGLVDAAQKWMQKCVLDLLADPKNIDETGDYFNVYLRECHRNIYDDIDKSDSAEVRSATYLASEKHGNSKKHRHNVGEIQIPHMDAAFEKLRELDLQKSKATTRHQRVLAKILIDAFQLRLVDLASILKMAQIVLNTPPKAHVVVVFYAGSDHTTNVTRFWQEFGFSSKRLAGRSVVGKTNWKDTESKALKMPAYLHDFAKLFPVP
jgi:hypothetical protein